MHELAITIDKERLLVARADGVRLGSACGHESGAFSAGELLGASLGSCIAASLEPLLSRHEADCSRLRVTVRPRGGGIEHGFAVIVTLPPMDSALHQRCRRAVAACPVYKALNIPVDLHWV